MNVDVPVRPPVVLVLVGVNVPREGLAQSPQPDANEHHADETFRPRGKQIHRQNPAQQQRQQADENHAAGVAEAPAQSGQPRPRVSPHRERRDRRQMVRPGEHMNEARHQTGENRNHLLARRR